MRYGGRVKQLDQPVRTKDYLIFSQDDRPASMVLGSHVCTGASVRHGVLIRSENRRFT